MSPSSPMACPGPRGFAHPAAGHLLTAMIDRIECGVMACGPRGELFHANVAARRQLENGRTLKIAQSHVRCAEPSQVAWASALHDAAVRKRSSLVCLDDGGERLMVALTPLQVEDDETPTAVAMMGRRSLCSPLGLEMLASRHALTIAEGRVFRALVGHCTPGEIAQSHGVAVATVRSQIQSVCDKLGVHGTSALRRLAAEFPLLMGYC